MTSVHPIPLEITGRNPTTREEEAAPTRPSGRIPFARQFYGPRSPLNTRVNIEDNENTNLAEYKYVTVTGNFNHYWRNINLLGTYKVSGTS